jgi:hypothetical protein
MKTKSVDCIKKYFVLGISIGHYMSAVILIEGIRRKCRSIKHWNNVENSMMRNVTGEHRYNERQDGHTKMFGWKMTRKMPH